MSAGTLCLTCGAHLRSSSDNCLCGGAPMSVESHGWEALRRKVFNRDMGCIVPTVDPRNGYPCKGMPTLDHVPERGKNALGTKAPDDEAHLVVICTYHHTGRNWPEGHREQERAYLAKWWPVHREAEDDT